MTMNITKLFSRQKEEELESEFHVSVYILVYKFGLGAVEFVAGTTLALFGAKLYQIYETSLIKELSEDPHDLLARLSMGVAPNLLTHHTFIVIYLIVLGAAKMAGAVGLAYKNWGVDLLVGLTIIMALFQIVNLILHWSVLDLLYLVVRLLIARYLVEFKPKAWVSRIFLRGSQDPEYRPGSDP